MDNSTSPVQMRGLNLRVGGKYRIKRKIGSGSFGVVYIGIDINSREEVAIKLEKKTIDPSMLQSEVSIYRSLSGGAGIPRVLWHAAKASTECWCLVFLGQLICRLRFMHRKHISHRDIKPHNFLMGVGRHGNQVYVADMGLAMEYDPDKTNIPSTHDSRRSMVGTPYFAAINNHFGFGQTQADDLEALGYTLIYFLRGYLPWHDVESTSQENANERTLEMKETITTQELCDFLPKEFALYFNHVKSLKGNEKPRYSYLRRIFRNLFTRAGFDYDFVFDWTALKYQMLMQQSGTES